MLCLVQAGVQVPSAAIMNFPRLTLSVGAAEAVRRVSPRSTCLPALSEVRAMKLKWGKLGKRRRRPCTGCPVSKTKKKSWRARKQSISRSKIWLAYAPSANHNYTDLALQLRFTRTSPLIIRGTTSGRLHRHGDSATMRIHRHDDFADVSTSFCVLPHDMQYYDFKARFESLPWLYDSTRHSGATDEDMTYWVLMFSIPPLEGYTWSPQGPTHRLGIDGKKPCKP
jgi:hypothetical protein